MKTAYIPKTKGLETSKNSLVNVLSTEGFTEKELTKLVSYIPVMDKTIASKCFMDFMQARQVLETNGQDIKGVVETLRTSKVNIHLITYYKRFTRVQGYTYPSVNKIWLNRKYHKGASLCSEASNLAHELAHKLGYKHSFKATHSRPFSVPYSINAAFSKCCNNN